MRRRRHAPYPAWPFEVGEDGRPQARSNFVRSAILPSRGPAACGSSPAFEPCRHATGMPTCCATGLSPTARESGASRAALSYPLWPAGHLPREGGE